MTRPLRRSLRSSATAKVPYSSRMPKKRLISDGLLSTPVQTIGRPDVDPEAVDISITNLEYIGSYNWVKTSSPTIVVPGSPPEWLNRVTPFKVKHNSGTISIDENARRMPSMPLVPLFRAIDMNTDVQGAGTFNWSSVDIITDRTNLRKLLHWASSSSKKVFRIDTQLAGEGTVLFNRWNVQDKARGDRSSYGFNFEKSSTSPAKGCDGTSSHHRIVKYELDGLKMVVRSEVDAHISTSTTRSDPVNAIQGSSVSSESQSSANPGLSLTVVRGGSQVPQSSLLEIKTKCSAGGALSMHYPQLYLSQTPHIFMATHTQGDFHTVRKSQLDLTRITETFAGRLKRLRLALGVIREVVIAGGKSGRLSLVLKDGELTVFERISKADCLPPKVLARF